MMPPVLTRRRLLVFLPLALLVLAAAYTAWLAWQVRGDLNDAQASADRLQETLDDKDPAGRDAAIRDLQEASSRAAEHTGGTWWRALTYVPLVGDDATGIRALSRSLDTLANDGVQPLSEAVDMLDDLSEDGRVDLDVVDRIAGPVSGSSAAFSDAADDVSGLDTSGYAGALRGRFDEYVATIEDADRALASADKAASVLPEMLGGDGPRDYLLVFQNNAEIRATGGLPGSWALMHAEDGKLTMGRQGNSSLGELPEPVLPLSDPEREVYDDQLGTFFQDAGFTPDFPRAAELLAARIELEIPGTDLDGVMAVDPVAMSYLLEGTGPVDVGETTLTSANVVDELLSRPYRELDQAAQDVLFQEAARKVFDAATGELPAPVEFVKGLSRAAEEGRFLVASYDPQVSRELSGSRVLGALASQDGGTPHVDIGLNDATGSKMSYYLRYFAEVRAESCASDRQSLTASMTLNQAISPNEAAQLPTSVTGKGQYGTEQGSQLLLVRVYGPAGGTVEDIRLDGRAISTEPVQLNGRPVVTLVVLLASVDDVVLTWSMQTGPSQTGDVELGMTPSIVPGNNDKVMASAC